MSVVSGWLCCSSLVDSPQPYEPTTAIVTWWLVVVGTKFDCDGWTKRWCSYSMCTYVCTVLACTILYVVFIFTLDNYFGRL
jgi:hypothetical protein